MEVKAKTNLEKHLTANKFYRVIERTDKEYVIMNDSNIKYSYPRKAFEATAESQTKIVNPNTTVSPMPGSNAMWVANGTSNPSSVLKVVYRKEDDEHLKRVPSSLEDYISRPYPSIQISNPFPVGHPMHKECSKVEKEYENEQRMMELERLIKADTRKSPHNVVIENVGQGLEFTITKKDDTINNGGSTDYYKINPEWKDLQDLIEERDLNYSQANILKVAFTFNLGRHEGTDATRDLNKIIYFAQRELNRLKK